MGGERKEKREKLEPKLKGRNGRNQELSIREQNKIVKNHLNGNYKLKQRSKKG